MIYLLDIAAKVARASFAFAKLDWFDLAGWIGRRHACVNYPKLSVPLFSVSTIDDDHAVGRQSASPN